MRKVLIIMIAACFVILFASPGFADAITWTELGSAGNLPSTANIIGGGVTQILGNLMDLNEVDMYQIMIGDFLNFSATVEDLGFGVDDTQLFLFDSAGLAVYMNDDGVGLGALSQLSAGSPLGPQSTGTYYLAIGWWDNEPLSETGLMLFESGGTTDLRGPDIGGGGGLSPVHHWSEDVLGRPDLPTAYSIQLTGATPVPEPATLTLVGIGFVGLFIIRRRHMRRNS